VSVNAKQTVSKDTLISFGCRFPVLSTYNRQAHLTFLINVWVIDLCFKCDLRRFKRVFCRECDLNPECTFIVWRVVLKNKTCEMVQNKELFRLASKGTQMVEV